MTGISAQTYSAVFFDNSDEIGPYFGEWSRGFGSVCACEAKSSFVSKEGEGLKNMKRWRSWESREKRMDEDTVL